ncbi:MAG TPA: hypothetical protein VLJ21_04110 [Candidatus Binatia bacterium]|nr:hypothetical protein [Candidatus Binatia bacterium]
MDFNASFASSFSFASGARPLRFAEYKPKYESVRSMRSSAYNLQSRAIATWFDAKVTKLGANVDDLIVPAAMKLSQQNKPTTVFYGEWERYARSSHCIYVRMDETAENLALVELDNEGILGSKLQWVALWGKERPYSSPVHIWVPEAKHLDSLTYAVAVAKDFTLTLEETLNELAIKPLMK